MRGVMWKSACLHTSFQFDLDAMQYAMHHALHVHVFASITTLGLSFQYALVMVVIAASSMDDKRKNMKL